MRLRCHVRRDGKDGLMNPLPMLASLPGVMLQTFDLKPSELVQMGALGVLLVAVSAYFWTQRRLPANGNGRAERRLEQVCGTLEKVCGGLATMLERQNAVHEDLQKVCGKQDDIAGLLNQLVGQLLSQYGGRERGR